LMSISIVGLAFMSRGNDIILKNCYLQNDNSE